MPPVRRSPRRRPRLFRKLLIANRGEIAVRILRACRELGIAPVAIYSEQDRNALHVRMADEAHLIGPAASSASYLNIDAILGAAKKSGAEAVHPGYGFLAENPDFSQACCDEGLIFVGPGAAAMRRLGNKIEGRKLMAAAGVPVIPGLEREQVSAREIKAWADRVGYPVLLKAASGGGGRGMRIVRSSSAMEASLAGARNEARSSFGDDTIFAERYLEGARHIEVQVLVDHDGRGIALGERECSVQRRHQKLVEEAPSPVVSPALRRRLGRLALKACNVAGYANAGTVEFLRDRKGDFYFLEMNARLQVEHPVTEMVTGVDLVQAQIRVAGGAPLPVPPGPLLPRGWAIECRIQAEDPGNGFSPSPGTIRLYRLPIGPRVRVDTGVCEGDEVSLHYDSLLAKLVTWGADREQAIATMASALSEFRIAGVRTTLPFHRRLMADAEFRRGAIDTGYLERLLARPEPGLEADTESAALLAAFHLFQTAATRRMAASIASADSWTLAGRQTQLRRGFLRNPWGET